MVVRREGYGTTNGKDFSYKITVDSVSVNSGSKAGGTTLTILGENFGPENNDNQVLIGDGTGLTNQFCDVI